MKLHIRSPVNNKHYKPIYCHVFNLSWPTAGFCSDMVAPESSTSPPLFWSQILLLWSRQQRKVLTPLPHRCFLHVWCLARPILDYCNTPCTCFDVITMCNFLPGWNLIEQWSDVCKRVRRQLVSKASVSWSNGVFCRLLSSRWTLEDTIWNNCAVIY